MGLPAAMPGTISAADHVRRSARPAHDHRHAVDLLLTLAAVESHASRGGHAVPPTLLRELVIITSRLAGSSWLEANADRAAAFTALLVTPEPPPLAELDQILARVLSDRFGLEASEGSRPPDRLTVRSGWSAARALSVDQQVRPSEPRADLLLITLGPVRRVPSATRGEPSVWA